MSRVLLHLVICQSILLGCVPIGIQAKPAVVKDTPVAAQANSSLAPAPTSSAALPSGPFPEACIPPIVISGYEDGETLVMPTQQDDVLPQGWDSVAEIPEAYRGSDAYITLTRSFSGYDELWVSVRPEGASTSRNNQYLIFRTDTKEWKLAPNPPGFGLFLDEKQGVWVTVHTEEKDAPRLYRLDQNSGRYLPVLDVENLLGSGNIESAVKVGSDGLFWFIFRDAQDNTALHEALYSFDPATRTASRYEIGEDFGSLEIDSQNNLYLVQSGLTLVKFNPANFQIFSVTLPPYISDKSSGASTLYLDSQNRLWVSDRARYDHAVEYSDIGEPFVLIRSPIFIQYDRYALRYVWSRPAVMLQSIDGRIWYDGNVWFDPSTGTWCKFTTYSSQIVAGQDDSLWMIAAGILFRLPPDR
jgi:hypothetical protein